MPTTIPYDPALVLGNLVDTARIDTLESISEQNLKIDAAQDKLNALIEAKRILDMTIREMINMGVGEEELEPLLSSVESVKTDMATAAAEYGETRLEAEKEIVEIKQGAADQGGVNSTVESPLDYNRTQIKSMPLSFDSIKLDAQYFSFDQNKQTADQHSATIKSYVSASTSVLGTKRSAEASHAASEQVSSQHEKHEIEGTLVITASCTHKDALLLAPFYLDPDKGIRAWNFSEEGKSDKLKVDDPKSMAEAAKEEGTENEKILQILSGCTLGSSFVGMVHVLRSESTDSQQKMLSTAASLQGQMETGNWFAKASGGLGVSGSFAKDAKRLLSSQEIDSHVSVITMGSIPSIKSNQVQLGVKTFAKFDPAEMMDKLASMQNATSNDQGSVQSAAKSARTGGEMLQIRASEVQSVMTGLDTIDDGANKMLDINSLMTAFEDYVEKALAGNIGVPINYYLKPITKAQLAQAWMAKYFPGEYLTMPGDDTEVEPRQSGGDEQKD